MNLTIIYFITFFFLRLILLKHLLLFLYMKIYVDIDNTICNTTNMDYENSTPIFENIEKVNSLFENNTIVMWTARGTLSNNNYFELTLSQLKKWGVKFNELRMGKPAFDLLIDDKALNSIYHWDNKNIKNLLKTN